jgi:hypothetical protein
MNTVDILKKARDHIAEPGMWYQGGYSAEGIWGAVSGKPCCALGAVIWALGVNEPPIETRAVLALDNAAPSGDTADFNDSPGTTHADVIALFDRAIAAEAAK